MGQLEKYGLYVLCLVIFLILGVSIWGHDDAPKPQQGTPPVAMHVPGGGADLGARRDARSRDARSGDGVRNASNETTLAGGEDLASLLGVGEPPRRRAREASADKSRAAVDADVRPPVVDQVPPGPNVTPGPKVTPGPQVTPVATTREYTIKGGDVLGVIAQRELGSVRHLDKILALNPRLDAKHLIPGKKIVLPVLDGKAAASGPSAAGAGAAEDRLERAGAYRTYVIADGDTLEGIARAELGSPRRVDELRQLNPKVDPRRMRVGQKIKLPLK